MLSEFNTVRGNCYDHHKMPARIGFKTTTYTNGFPIKPPVKKNESIGRNLYPQVEQKKQDPGPGSYESPVKRVQSLGYITKFRPAVKLHRKFVQEQKLGPGYYHYENIAGSTFLSNNRKSANFKYAKSNEKQRLKFPEGSNPGPGRYSYEGKAEKISNFSATKSHKMSITKRSSIIISNQNLGPGFYDWDKFYKKEKEKKKPIIEYKFIYGHPS